ncbi:MAG: alpha/beta fold hydrolase [Acidobacteriaceae bacterium]
MRPYSDPSSDPPVRGFLHEPAANATNAGLVLTHGAGADCESPLLVALAEAFSAAGFAVLRCDLPFRQQRPHGPPFNSAKQDQAGLRTAVESLRRALTPARIYLGGHSYGGRQATMLAAAEPEVADALLLLSYPLHPPRKPEQLRTQHFPQLRTPALFVHGARDPFGSLDELTAALQPIPARSHILQIESAGHELLTKTNRETLPSQIVETFLTFATS